MRESRENSVVFCERVAERAGYVCEYCLTPEAASFAKHQVDHIIPVKHGGDTTLDNLAFACALCKRRKGSDRSRAGTDTIQ